MTYMMAIERRALQQGYQQGFDQGIQEGKKQGIQQGLQQGLYIAIDLGIKLRFGDAGKDALDEIRKIDDIAVLNAIQEALMSATTPDEIRRIYA